MPSRRGRLETTENSWFRFQFCRDKTVVIAYYFLYYYMYTGLVNFYRRDMGAVAVSFKCLRLNALSSTVTVIGIACHQVHDLVVPSLHVIKN